ncbi:hypothetical protein PCC7424_0422 [Gloeothece citriformis PCC 7424]|uniref:Uncharacterized protein n=1 Tax=Gloeothece citriformis (strain PCC 7424) TaxID=65393 RepID=B7KC64_GLOC7|nr:hypothetical protein [Gloeothece citriformis]ACK68887.1 hypothetical protein PCC7424_0421 [Gloeothece citriformis PCC 7424]ACK68888.1 hypothetical protein PCC7424_0422 [Gloeothece citriformis PCC 7424]
MSNISITDINPSGSSLFADVESYLNDLSEQDINNILGGGKVSIAWSLICVEW